MHRCEPSATNEKGYEREFGQGYLEELHNVVLGPLEVRRASQSDDWQELRCRAAISAPQAAPPGSREGETPGGRHQEH